MRNRILRGVCMFASLTVALATHPLTAAAQPASEQRPLRERLRTMYFQQDFEGVYRTGESEGVDSVGDQEAYAWYSISLARSSRIRQAVAAAECMEARWPDDPWTLVARSIVTAFEGRQDDAVQVAASAAETASDNPYTWWALGFIRQRGQQYDAVVAMVDSIYPRRFQWVEFQVLKANALLAQAGRDSAKREVAFASFAEVRAMDPSNTHAHFFPAAALVNSGEPLRAMPLLQRTRELAPVSSSVLRVYAMAVTGRKDLQVEERRAEIRKVVNESLRGRESYAGALTTAADVFRIVGDSSAAHEVDRRILEQFPESGEAEVVLASWHRALEDSITNGLVADSTAAREKLVRMLWDYVDRSRHEHESLLGEAYLKLFRQVGWDSTTADDVLLRIARGVDHYSTTTSLYTSHSDPPAALAERGVFFREAEEIVRHGLSLIPRHLAERGFATAADEARAEDWLTAIHRGTLGWIYLNEGRLSDADRALSSAAELDPYSGAISFYRGRLAELNGNLQEAESHYASSYARSGVGVNRRRQGGTIAALERVYQQLHGSSAGWEPYMARLAVRERELRREAVLASRDPNPQPMIPFALQALHGEERVESSRGAGKIMVVNFWGVWCGPCVQEAPDIQRVYDRYRDNSDVLFLTVDYNDSNIQMVRDWMQERDFDFPVLLDDGYVNSAKVTGFPTTWFVNRGGEIEFAKIGGGPEVYEEFVWRIDALLGAGGAGLESRP